MTKDEPIPIPDFNPMMWISFNRDQIKENRRAGGISAGPQSQILEGVSWEEAKQVQDASMSSTGGGDQVILVGAASKGIIQRNFQHHAVVYKTPYAKNPFDSITNEEIEEYKQQVQRKQRGDGKTNPLSSYQQIQNFLPHS